MLDAGWCSLLREKLTLARQILGLAEERWHLNTAAANEGLVQGAVALLGEARSVLLKLAADTSQIDDFQGVSLAALQEQVGDQPGEVRILEGLAQQPESWWCHLDALLSLQKKPGRSASNPRSEGLIAVASEAGPDRSVSGIKSLIGEFRAYFEAFTERHDQW